MVPIDSERRVVTVLFADIAGFTAISERLGEEGAYALVQPLYRLMADAVKEQGGTVGDFTGDGIMALFGMPASLEDASLRACRAALTIQERLAESLVGIESRHGVRPLMRIGVNTGQVVVGQVGAGEAARHTAIGDTVNLASRLQNLAEPGAVLLSEAAYRLSEGLVEATSLGQHEIRGKAERQVVYRLDGLRQGAVRFDVALTRGLTAYVGRTGELEVLADCLAGSGHALRVVDIVGEPGMGKSRLLHEFVERPGTPREAVLRGTCSPNGQQTPFLPFIEVVRGLFDVAGTDSHEAIARKFQAGLGAHGLDSLQNLGLLLHLLGLRPPADSLKGLDGPLIGSRTRKLLLLLLQARCRLAPTILLMEDLHWMDSASADFLNRVIRMDPAPSLLIVNTSRPEYRPPWAGNPNVTPLRLAALSPTDTSRILQARLGTVELPEALDRLVVSKAEGNALFAEEIVTFLLERGAVQRTAGGVTYDPGQVAAAMPTSIQTLLSARVDRLGEADRKLLQAASVIGRRFDLDLLETMAGGQAGVAKRLARLEALDLVNRDDESGEHQFKHALVRDALYGALLGDARRALHLAAAEAIERRGHNRLAEVAEALAHHYEQTDRTEKTYRYLVMAGTKCLGVYSLDEAERYFDKALSLFETVPSCSDPMTFAGLLAKFTSLLAAQNRHSKMLDIVDRHMARLDALGDLPQSVIVLGNYVTATMCASRWPEMVAQAERSLAMAERLGDDRSKACARASWIVSKCVLGLSTAEEAQRHIALALAESQRVDDSHLHVSVLWACVWDCFQRGLSDHGRAYGRQLQERGRRLGDPRALATGLWMIALFDLVDERYEDVHANAVASLDAAVTPADRAMAEILRGMALVFRGRLAEGVGALTEVRAHCLAEGWTSVTSATDVPIGVAMVLQGDIAGGVRFIEESIERHQSLGFVVAVDLARLNLTEIYLAILGAQQKPSLRVLVKNFRFLAVTAVTGWKRAMTMMVAARQNVMFAGASHWRARIEANIGFLYILKKRHAEGRECLLRARPIADQIGSTALVAKIDAALAMAQ